MQVRKTIRCQYAMVAAGVCAFALASCDWNDYRVIKGSTMGTYYRVVQKCDDPVARDDIDRVLEDVDRMFSSYRPESTVSRFNAAPNDSWLDVEPDFVSLLKKSHQITVLTAGAFDITVAPLVQVWGFGPSATSGPPTSSDVQQAMRNVGQEPITTRKSPPAVYKHQPMELDFSGIAKGFAVDRVSGLIESSGCKNFLVDIGGEARTKGTNRSGHLWTIGLERPDGSGIVDTTIELRDAAVATSGTYRNLRQAQDRQISHIIDPRTGMPVTHNVVAVTVVAADATTADALATGLLVMGEVAALELANVEQIPIRLVVRDKEREFLAIPNQMFLSL